MVPPSTTLKPAGSPSLAECASRFQWAVPSTCQMPFRSGFRSGVRGPVYADAPAATGARVGEAPRCAEAARPAIAMISTARPTVTPTTAIGFSIPIRGSLLRPPAVCQRTRSPRRQREAEDQVAAAAAPLAAARSDRDELFTIDHVDRR